MTSRTPLETVTAHAAAVVRYEAGGKYEQVDWMVRSALVSHGRDAAWMDGEAVQSPWGEGVDELAVGCGSTRLERGGFLAGISGRAYHSVQRITPINLGGTGCCQCMSCRARKLPAPEIQVKAGGLFSKHIGMN